MCTCQRAPAARPGTRDRGGPCCAARHHLEAAVLLGGLIDVDHDRDVQALAVHPPARGVILMRLEALAAGVLEVDLLLVEDGSVAVEELGDEVEEALAVEGF